MVYNLTEKLKLGEDPKLVIHGTELTVCADAEVVLKLMDIVQEKGETGLARQALGLLLSEKDRKKLAALHLKMDDYAAVVKAAVQLAMGADPDGEEAPGE